MTFPKDRRGRLLPPPVDPVAKAYAKKLRKVREARGLTRAEAAGQLGLATAVYERLEQGNFVPARWVQSRVKAWARKGKRFNYGDPKGPDIKVETHPVTIVLPRQEFERLLVLAERTGSSVPLLVRTMVLGALERGDTVTNLTRMVELYHKARVELQLCDERPELIDFLEMDMETVTEVGGHVENATVHGGTVKTTTKQEKQSNPNWEEL